MHKKGLAHLDVKLENIVMDSNYNAKLIDYAFFEPKNRPLREIKGTTPYMAPEILSTKLFRFNCFEGEKADVFSLGVVLFTMFFSQHPFAPEEYNELFKPEGSLFNGDLHEAEVFFQRNRKTRVAHKAGHIPLNLKMLLVKMLNVDPKKRPSLEELVEHDEWIREAYSDRDASALHYKYEMFKSFLSVHHFNQH